MVKFVFVLALGSLLLQGCATTSSSGNVMALENRVQTLENRLAVVEADLNVTSAVSSSPSLDVLLADEKVSSVSSPSAMTKEDIQQALKNAGYYAGPLDGKIGPKTRSAVREFQDDMGLKVDGVVGRNTKEKLFKYLR